MFIVLETTANRRNPEAYGQFVQIHHLTKVGGIRDYALEEAYEKACDLLTVDQPKMIHTAGVTGATNLLMVADEMDEMGTVQLFSEFQSSKRIWIIHRLP